VINAAYYQSDTSSLKSKKKKRRKTFVDNDERQNERRRKKEADGGGKEICTDSWLVTWRRKEATAMITSQPSLSFSFFSFSSSSRLSFESNDAH
jgi:hypothetical protein